MRTLYVSDLDGTLLNRQICLSNNTIQTINQLIAEGMLFTYATARSYETAKLVTRGMTSNMPIIVYNGACILNAKTKEVLYSSGFEVQQKQFISDLLKSHRLNPLVYAYQNGVEKVSWVQGRETPGQLYYLEQRKGDRRLNPLVDETTLYQGDVFYFTCIGEQEDLKPIYELLQNHSEYRCTLQQELYRPEYWCEIMPKQTTKANAILKLKDLCGCDKVICFGDAINDIPMFSIADESYAVENAVEELKAVATGVIGQNQDDGVAKWLKQHWKK